MFRSHRSALACAALFLLAAATQQGACAQAPTAKAAQSRNGMLATGNPFATAAGVKMLEAGGNAVDAAAAACFALMVADAPMTSIAGRAQIVIALRDGRIAGFDGATQAPAAISPLRDDQDDRSGYQVVPVPGNPAVLAEMVRRYGKLPLAAVLAPAIELAENGFAVTPSVARIWAAERDGLAATPGARENYLKPDGGAFTAGQIYRNRRLARVLRALAESGPDVFYRGWIGKAIADDVAKNGGFLRAADLGGYRPEAGVIVRTKYRGYEVVSLGRHAWGNTLVEMLQILGHFPVSGGEPKPEDAELLARVIWQALADRPQLLGSLKPKSHGLPLEKISSREFARERAAQIRDLMRAPAAPAPVSMCWEPAVEHGDTTHIAVMDAEGNAVSMTTSIGPRFGARVATPELGFLYAHSYRMRSDPAPGERDLTEMTPTIVLRNGRPILALGAAGSEQIPGAILQVISNTLDRGYPLEKAVVAPRVSWSGKTLRVQSTFRQEIAGWLRARGFPQILIISGDMERHLGIVQAVQYDAASKTFSGAADPVYDGAAAGPLSPRKKP